MRLLVIIAKSDAQTSFIPSCSELSCLLMLVPQLLVEMTIFVRLTMLRLLDTDHSLANAMLKIFGCNKHNV